jgi:hypothetical protein
LSAASARGSYPLHADLEAILQELDKSEVEARNLTEGLSDEQLNWQPNGGRSWSIAQCLDHLAKTNAVYTAAMVSATSSVPPGSRPRRGPIRPGWLERYFINAMDAPPRRKFSTNKKVLPRARKSGSEMVADFVASHDAVRSLIETSRELDLNRIRFKNPFVGFLRFTVGTGLLVIGAHDRRHLWQAREVLRLMNSGK